MLPHVAFFWHLFTVVGVFVVGTRMCWEKNTHRIGTGCELKRGLNVDSERKTEGTGKKIVQHKLGSGLEYGLNVVDWNMD
jgi:hypothetical protein